MFSLPREKMQTGGYRRLLSKRENHSFLSKFLQKRRRKTKHFTEELQHENGSSLVSRICPNLTSVKFLVLVLDIQNATVISTPNFHSYSNAKVIKKQVWLKVQLWITSILQLPHLNNSEQSLAIKCDLQTWVVNTNICYVYLFKYCEGRWAVWWVYWKRRAYYRYRWSRQQILYSFCCQTNK